MSKLEVFFFNNIRKQSDTGNLKILKYFTNMFVFQDQHSQLLTEV